MWIHSLSTKYTFPIWHVSFFPGAQRVPEVSKSRGFKVKRVPEVYKGFQVQRVPEVSKCFQVQRVPEVSRGFQVQRIPEVSRGFQVQRVPEVYKGIQVQRIPRFPSKESSKSRGFQRVLEVSKGFK